MWISFDDESPLHTSREQLYLPAARYYRRAFTARSPVRRATARVSALGLYELRINGRRVGDALFTPGWSDYRRRVYYQEYDVSRLLRTGDNVVAAIVADGWYSGYVGFGLLVGLGPHRCGRYLYGKTPALWLRLEVEYEDGRRESWDTGPEWRVAAGGLQEADILMGERFDARREPVGWDAPGYDDSSWESAIHAADNGSLKAPFIDGAGEREVELGFIEPAAMQLYPGPPIRVTQTLAPVRILRREDDAWLVDFGQNFSGVVRLQARGPAGTTIVIRHAEATYDDGRLMTENLRRARATDTWILRGEGDGETYQPRFTYHGFRYAEVTGYPGELSAEDVTGLVIHSDTPLVSEFECADPVVNRVFSNIVWTQRANFFEVPTDCPQRDERLGWTGDAQAYIRAAAWNADVHSFFIKWLDDLEESQLPEGAYPAYAPFPMQHGERGYGWGTAWMDAGIICPWTIWQVYDDTDIIDRHWQSMTRFMEFRRRRAPDGRGRRDGNTWGDWLALGEETPIELIDAAYFALTARMMAEMAEVTGRKKEAAAYRALHDRIAETFRQDYWQRDGRLSVDTQTAYALALFVGLLAGDEAQTAADRLAAKIRANGTRMSTGFIGTRPLLPVLSRQGHHNLAIELMQSRRFPSWGYEVENGATTIWERWNSYTHDGGFHEPGMNSFSHYAFGAVCEWMFSALVGIETESPGFARLRLTPGPPTRFADSVPPMTWARARYESPRGPIALAWRIEDDSLAVDIDLPPDLPATLYLPTIDPADITESGAPLNEHPTLRLLRADQGVAVVELPGGRYSFCSPWHVVAS